MDLIGSKWPNCLIWSLLSYMRSTLYSYKESTSVYGLDQLIIQYGLNWAQMAEFTNMVVIIVHEIDVVHL